jgi:ribokinase
MPVVTVVGSTNTDLVINTPRLPQAGETVKGTHFHIFPGGKGANQAVAASRLGAEVNFISKIGRDDFGKSALANFIREGIRTDYILIDEKHHSGVAFIEVDQQGQNRIIIASGANGNLTIEDIEPLRHVIENADVILVQLEIPIATVGYVLEVAARSNVLVILNPAPAEPLPENFYQNLNIITPNETEAALLTGLDVSSYPAMAKAFQLKGVDSAIITLGEKGAYFISNDNEGEVAAFKAKPVDTTAAGDAFNAGLAVALAEGKLMKDAIVFANAVAALSVMKMGAQPSMPFREDVERFLAQNKT